MKDVFDKLICQALFYSFSVFHPHSLKKAVDLKYVYFELHVGGKCYLKDNKLNGLLFVWSLEMFYFYKAFILDLVMTVNSNVLENVMG